MRSSHAIVVLNLVLAGCGRAATTVPTCEQPVAAAPHAAVERPQEGFDPELAAELGADEYGMRAYVIAFLRVGPNRPKTPELAAELQRAHMANIDALAESGKLAVAGPFMDDGELRGIYVFAVATVDEARELTETDPAIAAGSLQMELHPWYGSAALMQVPKTHRQVASKNP